METIKNDICNCNDRGLCNEDDECFDNEDEDEDEDEDEKGEE